MRESPSKKVCIVSNPKKEKKNPKTKKSPEKKEKKREGMRKKVMEDSILSME
jgi:hypothetical protein